jgi:polyhydroxybutyrate depolymerase
MVRRSLWALAFLLLSVAPASACGPDSDCALGERHYRIALPDGHDGTRPIGAILHAHGYKGSAAGAMRNNGLRQVARDLGLALIAADSKGDDWSLPHSPATMREGKPADLEGELTYFEAVLDDAARRFGVDRTRVLATGFSAGGMMVWWLACHRSDLAAGFAPISGTFWAPVPDACPADPAHLLHTHDMADPVVPLDGRTIGPAKQGEVMRALAMYRATGGFVDAQTYGADGLDCTRWRNPDGKLLELCLHPGGHSMDGRFVRRAWRALAEAGALARDGSGDAGHD